MRHQKVTAWVSVSGTALSIFPGARVFMVQEVKIVGVAPETNRERILIGGSLDIHAFKDGGKYGRRVVLCHIRLPADVWQS